MHAHIIYFNFLNPNGEGMSIGGIQTYLFNLIPVLKDSGYDVTVYQRSTVDFHKKLDGYDVIGIYYPEQYGQPVAQKLFSVVLSNLNNNSDLLIYGCESCITSHAPCRTIAIQHGISWDIPIPKCSNTRYIRHYISECRVSWKTIKRISKTDTLVCVDYNFLNWYRAICPYIKTKPIVIPNFSDIPENQPQKEHDGLHIIFARRFFPHRGTRLFANIAVRILNEHNNVFITIAGTGPDADYLHSKLDNNNQVTFITYDSQDSLKLHKDKDIAVIPTLGSEGTSLSLLEAMASGCAVVCTNVGGMTNIVLDRHNGLIINPDENSLYNAINELINNYSLRSKLQRNAYNTVKDAFSLEIWRNKWFEVLSPLKTQLR